MCSMRSVLFAVLLWPVSVMASEPVKVVTSFSILADLVEQVGGDRVDVDTLVGVDSDAHVFQPAPADARKVAQSDLLVINGLGYEGWLERLIEASGYTGPVVVATDGIIPLKTEASEPGHSHDDGHDHGPVDPHAWHDVSNVVQYVHNIQLALSELDPDHADEYLLRARRYQARLYLLDDRLKKSFAAIDAEQRKVISSHAAFGYMGRAYQIAFFSVQGLSTESETSASSVADLIRLIREENIQAMFVENTSDTRMLEQISRETGIEISGSLYTGALAASGPASTYIGFIESNAQLLMNALTAP